PLAEDRGQQHDQHLRQAPGRQPGRGDRACARGRPRRPSVSHAVVIAAGVLPAVTLIGGGLALVPTRSRLSGCLATASGLLVLVSRGAWATGHDEAGVVLLTVALALPLALAVIAYPTLRLGHPVDYCALVLVAAAGVIGSVYHEDGAVDAAMALALAL